ncbi:MAG: alcohol dehydrogenase catalytic domain-containing protein [Clostridia bacterium]|nr:alcohol dehydrogenase catalytic domain-containing protein [Clostridia bacterium]
MDNWVLMSPKKLVNHTDYAQSVMRALNPDEIRVKVSHILVTDFDALVYTGTTNAICPKTIGHAALGIINETGPDVLTFRKGQRVYLRAAKPCGKCMACRSGHPEKCVTPILAGKDFDGYLRDMLICKAPDIMYIPEGISDIHALCTEAVGIAEAIYDRLKLNAGDKVAVVGMGFYGNIIAQTLKYHKIVPIGIDNNTENLLRSERAGVFFNFAADDDLLANIKSVTSGNFCDAAIYCAASHISPTVAARVCSSGKTIILTSPSAHNSSIDIHEILEKSLIVTAITTAYGYTASAVRLLQNNAINTDFYEKKIYKDVAYDPVAILEERDENSSNYKANKLTIIQTVI